METVLLSALALAAGVVFGATGFGFAVVLMAIYPLIVDITSANVIVTLVGLVIPFYLLYGLRGSVRWGVLARVFVGAALGIPLGVRGLVRFDERTLMLSLGTFLVLYVLYDVLFKPRFRMQVPTFLGYFSGVVAGAFMGAFTAGGPPVVAYLTSLELDKHELKANIVAFILVATIYKVFFLLLHGVVTTAMAINAAIVLPSALVGVLIGQLVFRWLSSPVFTRVVQLTLICSAIYMVATNIGG